MTCKGISTSSADNRRHVANKERGIEKSFPDTDKKKKDYLAYYEKSQTEKEPFSKNNARLFDLRRRIRQWLARVKELHGSPHYVALGLALGVFVSATPTIPFQTAIALGLAFILRGSRIAAAAGTWVSNPATIPFLYLESYKTGSYLFRISNTCGQTCQSMSELLKQGLDVALATITGGVILGIPGGMVAYLIARIIIIKIKSSKR